MKEFFNIKSKIAHRFLYFILILVITSPTILTSQNFNFECGTNDSKLVVQNNCCNAKSPVPFPGTGYPKVMNVRIKIHFVLRSNGTGNYNETTGPTSWSSGWFNNITGYKMATDIINTANWLMKNNADMYQPIGNITPTRDPRIKWILDGIYFHRSNTLFNNSTSMAALSSCRNLCVNSNSSINVFFWGNDFSNASGQANYIGIYDKPRVVIGGMGTNLKTMFTIKKIPSIYINTGILLM